MKEQYQGGKGGKIQHYMFYDPCAITYECQETSWLQVVASLG